MHFTRSRAIRYLVELGLANNILDKHMKVIIEALSFASKQETRRNQRPYRDNSYRSAYTSAQNRTLLTNILRLFIRLLQEPPETAQRIIRQSEQDARDALTFLSPNIADLIRQHEHDKENSRVEEEGEQEG